MGEFPSAGCPYGGIDHCRAVDVTKIWSQRYGVMYLGGRQIGKQTALPSACIRMMSIMFKITQNTVHRFSLAEILLMAAMNEVEAERRPLAPLQRTYRDQIGVGDDRTR